MTREETEKCLNNAMRLLQLKAYSNVYDPNAKAPIVDAWYQAFKETEKSDLEYVIQYIAENVAIKEYQAYGIKEIKELVKNHTQHRLEHNGSRRIQTPEGDCANEYIEIMELIQRGRAKLTQELKDYLLRLKPYYLLFHGDGWEDRYRTHFGKDREEFEKYE